MAKKTGKEVMVEITTAQKEFKVLDKAANNALKEKDKAFKKLTNLIDRFPEKERELYEERLTKIVGSVTSVEQD